jgi:hypothetical protein
MPWSKNKVDGQPVIRWAMIMANRRKNISLEALTTLIAEKRMGLDGAARYLGISRNTIYYRMRQDPKWRAAIEAAVAERRRPAPSKATTTLVITGVPVVVADYLEKWAERRGMTVSELYLHELIFNIELDLESRVVQKEVGAEEVEEWLRQIGDKTVNWAR